MLISAEIEAAVRDEALQNLRTAFRSYFSPEKAIRWSLRFSPFKAARPLAAPAPLKPRTSNVLAARRAVPSPCRRRASVS
jgi:hypothetical protein